MEPLLPPVSLGQVTTVAFLAAWQAAAFAALASAMRAVTANAQDLTVLALFALFGLGGLAAGVPALHGTLTTTLLPLGVVATLVGLGLTIARPDWRLVVRDPRRARRLELSLGLPAASLAGVAILALPAARLTELASGVDAATASWIALIVALALTPIPAIVCAAAAAAGDALISVFSDTIPAGVSGIALAALAVLALARREDGNA